MQLAEVHLSVRGTTIQLPEVHLSVRGATIQLSDRGLEDWVWVRELVRIKLDHAASSYQKCIYQLGVPPYSYQKCIYQLGDNIV